MSQFASYNGADVLQAQLAGASAPLSIAAALRIFVQHLAAQGVDSPKLSAELLLCKVLQKERVYLIAHDDAVLTEAELSEVSALVARRGAGEPAAYLLGVKEFYGRDFCVNSATLIPRPDSEVLIEAALTFAKGLLAERAGCAVRGENAMRAECVAEKAPKIFFSDWGTGTGCLVCTFAAEEPRAQGIALDKSSEALRVAQKNAANIGVAKRVQFLRGDFTQTHFTAGSLDVILANPPYISNADYAELSPEVREFEPKTALVSGDSGMDDARDLLPRAHDALCCGGAIFLEFGYTQGADMLSLAGCTPYAGAWSELRICQDLAGRDRFLFGRKG